MTEQLKQKIYDLRRLVNRLQHMAFGHAMPGLTDEQRSTLKQAQLDMFAKERELAQLEDEPDDHSETETEPDTVPTEQTGQTPRDGGGIGTTHYFGRPQRMHSGNGPQTFRGLESTGLEVDVRLQMEHVPTALLHLFDKNSQPLIKCTVRTNATRGKRRVRITSFIEGYTARAVDTRELSAGEGVIIQQLPTLFPSAANPVNELTRATLNVLAEDLDSQKIEIHKTLPVWLLARNSVPLGVKNPADNSWTDLSYYLGAFVTPHQPQVLAFLRHVVDKIDGQMLVGYQDAGPSVRDQVKAIYEVLQEKTEIRYIDTTIDYPHNELAPSQRVRMPRETLVDRSANCLDGTLLFASVMEAISLNPCIVLIPGHAFVGWETWDGSDEWHYLETTMVADKPFDQAVNAATYYANEYTAQRVEAEAANNPDAEWLYRQWSMKELRAQMGITPME